MRLRMLLLVTATWVGLLGVLAFYVSTAPAAPPDPAAATLARIRQAVEDVDALAKIEADAKQALVEAEASTMAAVAGEIGKYRVQTADVRAWWEGAEKALADARARLARLERSLVP